MSPRNIQAVITQRILRRYARGTSAMARQVRGPSATARLAILSL